MTFQATTTGAGRFTPSAPRKTPNGFLSRLLARLAGSRQERGRRIAYVHLARLSDSALHALGHDRRQIEEIRKVASRGVISY